MTGDLPPNSSETGFKLLLAAARITSRPTSVEPVKLTYTSRNHQFTIKPIILVSLYLNYVILLLLLENK